MQKVHRIASSWVRTSESPSGEKGRNEKKKWRRSSRNNMGPPVGRTQSRTFQALQGETSRGPELPSAPVARRHAHKYTKVSKSSLARKAPPSRVLSTVFIGTNHHSSSPTGVSATNERVRCKHTDKPQIGLATSTRLFTLTGAFQDFAPLVEPISAMAGFPGNKERGEPSIRSVQPAKGIVWKVERHDATIPRWRTNHKPQNSPGAKSPGHEWPL